MDDEIRELQRKVEGGDEQAAVKLKAMKTRLGMQLADADYLLQYTKICDDFIDEAAKANNERNLSAAKRKAKAALRKLNETFRHLVNPITIREEIKSITLADHFEDEGGWDRSSC